MFCPHCHNKIPDGSNICPLCYSNLAGVKAHQAQEPRAQVGGEEQAQRRKTTSAKKPAYTKGSRGSKKKKDSAPMIIAFGLIVILVVIIVMIVRSMFGVGTAPVTANNTPPAIVTTTNAPAQNFIVFGATATPQKTQVVTPTPNIEVTPTPAPVAAKTYVTLRKGDEGPDVVTMQLALTELGYLSGASDGNFGTGTMNAVKKFQQDNGLDADGIAGKLTLEMLYTKSSVTPMPDSTPAVKPGDILDLPG